MLLQILQRLLIHWEDPVLASGLDRHICDREAVIHGEGMDTFSRELHRPVERTSDADHADDGEDEVLSGDIPPQPAGEIEAYGGRHLEPCLADGHPRRHVGGSDARGERSKRSIGAGMAVCADHGIACRHQTLLGKKGMLDADPSHLEVVRYALLLGEGADACALLGRLDVLVRSEVIRDERDPVPVEYAFFSEARKLLYRDRARDVIAEHHIQISHDQLPRMDLREPRRMCEDLLRHRHSHQSTSLSVCPISMSLSKESDDILFLSDIEELLPSSMRFTALRQARIEASMTSVDTPLPL